MTESDILSMFKDRPSKPVALVHHSLRLVLNGFDLRYLLLKITIEGRTTRNYRVHFRINPKQKSCRKMEKNVITIQKIC